MRAKKVFVMMVVVLSMVAIFTINAYATEWYNCTVVRAGSGYGGATYIKLTDENGAFYNRWFLAANGQEKEMLAVALTAMTNNMKVNVGLSSASEFSYIYCIFLMQD